MSEFGYHEIGGSWLNTAAGRFFGSIFTLSDAGTITDIGCYLDTDSGANLNRFAIYTTGGTLLGSTGEGAAESSGGWLEKALTVPYVAAAADYVLCWWCSEAGTYSKYTSGASARENPSDLTYPNWPATVDFADVGNMKISIYATYTAGGAASNVVYMLFES